MHTVSLKPTTSPSTSHLQGREVLVELEPIGIQFDVIRYMSSSLNSLEKFQVEPILTGKTTINNTMKLFRRSFFFAPLHPSPSAWAKLTYQKKFSLTSEYFCLGQTHLSKEIFPYKWIFQWKTKLELNTPKQDEVIIIQYILPSCPLQQASY